MPKTDRFTSRGRTCLFGLFILSAFAPANASAYTRAADALPVSVAKSDLIVVARPTRIPEQLFPPAFREQQLADFKIRRVLKGELAETSLTLTMPAPYSYIPGESLSLDHDYVLYLDEVDGKPGSYGLVFGGWTAFHSPALETSITQVLERTPPWSKPQHGLATTLVADRYTLSPGDHLSLSVLYRNDSSSTITLHRRNWPQEPATYWELDVESSRAGSIPPAPVWFSTNEGSRVQSLKSGTSETLSLSPGEIRTIWLSYVNTGQKGYGTKRELLSHYYPIDVPGEYRIRVRAKNLVPEGDIVTGVLRLEVTE